MGRIQPNFGNSMVLLVLQSSGALPTTPTLWNGSTGNVFKFSDNAKGNSRAAKEVSETEYKTNDDALYDTKEEILGIISGTHYDRSELPATFLETALTTAKANGQRILCHYNAGYVSGKWKEITQIGVVNGQIVEEDDKVDTTFPVEHKSTPPVSALTISTTYQASINTAVGAGTIKASAAIIVPAAPTVRKVTFTT